MRILILCDVLFPYTTGGAGRVARELAVAFRKMGHPVHFLTRKTRRGAPGETIPTAFFPPPGKASRRLYRQIFQRTLDDFGPDVVLSHQPLAAFLCMPEGCRAPVVSVFHSSWPREFQLKASPIPRPIRWLISPLLSRIEGRVLSRSRAVVVLSEYSRREVQTRYQLASLVIPGGVDSQRFRPSGKRQAEGGGRLITLRNLVPRMGLRALIDSIPLLPAPVRLTIGGEGPLRSALERQVRRLGIEDRIRLLGHVPDSELTRFYGSGDWFILPTLTLEGFGLVILESLACGTPVIGTRIGAIPELLERFDARWLIPEPTPRSIAAALQPLIGSARPDPRELHGKIASEFDWRRIAELYLDQFRAFL